jgi:hypothetical protein
MKRLWLSITALSVFLVCPAFAQPSWTTKAKASVPFEFVVNGTTLPAGDYRIMTYGIGNAVLIQNVDNPDRKMIVQNRNVVLSPNGTILKDTKLIFALNNGQHVLHQIGVADDDHIHDMVHSADVVELVATR